MFADTKLQAPSARAISLLRSLGRTLFFLALLLLATLDGRLRHALGLLHDGPDGAVWIHRWCRRMVRCLGIACTVDGELPGRLAASGGGFEAVVCNHLSYIDILLMSAVRPFVMVAKTEVRAWPLLGWLTAQAGTVYVTRGGKPETYPAVNAAMAHAYRSGLPVLFFPEGTTTDGSEVLPFRRGLFHSVLRDSVQVRTAALAYAWMIANPKPPSPKTSAGGATPPSLPISSASSACAACTPPCTSVPLSPGADRFALSENAHAAVSALYADLTGESRLRTGPPLADSARLGISPAWCRRSRICSTDQSSASVPSTVTDARAAEGITYSSAIGCAVASNCSRTDSSVRPRSRTSR